MSEPYEHVEIHWLEAVVAFGPDKTSGIWPVSEHSDGFSVTVDIVEDGKKTEWIIPFDVADTRPSKSGKSGHRTLTRELDMKKAEGHIHEG